MKQTKQYTEKEKNIAVMMNKGFHITFKNGWTVSIQIGCCNYCDNYDDLDFNKQLKEGSQSNTAEVWAWNKKKDKYFPKNQKVT